MEAGFNSAKCFSNDENMVDELQSGEGVNHLSFQIRGQTNEAKRTLVVK